VLKLVSDATYELAYKQEGEPEDKWPVFVLRKLSAAAVNRIDDQTMRLRQETGKRGENPDMHVLAGTARKLKIDEAVRDWRNVVDENENPVPCTSVNKERLPAEVQSWIETEIDGTNKVKGMPEDERKN
jgi:hypothetical protein